VDLFGRNKRSLIMIGVSVIVLIILVWQYVNGGSAALREGFVPVNVQLEQLLQDTEEAGMKAAETSKASSAPSVSKASPTLASNDLKENKVQQTQAAEGKPVDKPQEQASSEDAKEKFDINTATLEQLDTLPGIGESKAKAILAYRTEIGQFRRVEDLLEVKGIGEKVLEKLRPHLYIASP
jgi:competence protein ComEA